MEQPGADCLKDVRQSIRLYCALSSGFVKRCVLYESLYYNLVKWNTR